MTHKTHSDEAIVKELYNKDPYRYRNIPNSKNNWEYEDGLKNVREALAQARADQDRIARAEELEKIQKVMQILTYISTRNREHNAVCIPKAKEALEILTTQYNNTV